MLVGHVEANPGEETAAKEEFVRAQAKMGATPHGIIKAMREKLGSGMGFYTVRGILEEAQKKPRQGKKTAGTAKKLPEKLKELVAFKTALRGLVPQISTLGVTELHYTSEGWRLVRRKEESFR